MAEGRTRSPGGQLGTARLAALALLVGPLCGPRQPPWSAAAEGEAVGVRPSLYQGSDLDFILLSRHLPGLLVRRPYETKRNAFKTRLYTDHFCFLRRGTAKKLAEARKLLGRQRLSLEVWDAYRPLSVQKQMWRLLPDRRYVAAPDVGSHHNRGAAVDVTLVTKSGRELRMPTAYDDFTRRAHHSYRGGSAESRRNRELLKRVMSAAGFQPLATEWWHWEDREWRRYPVVDKSAKELLR